jgi:pyrrolidone-carboxylate peptidase
MYHVLNHIDQTGLKCNAGFIHVPFMEEQKKPENAFSLPIDVILESIIDSIKVTIFKGKR